MFLLNKLFLYAFIPCSFPFLLIGSDIFLSPVDNARLKHDILAVAESNSLLLDVQFIPRPRFKFPGQVALIAESTLHETTNLIPATWLVHLVECQTALLEVEGLCPRPDQH